MKTQQRQINTSWLNCDAKTWVFSQTQIWAWRGEARVEKARTGQGKASLRRALVVCVALLLVTLISRVCGKTHVLASQFSQLVLFCRCCVFMSMLPCPMVRCVLSSGNFAQHPMNIFHGNSYGYAFQWLVHSSSTLHHY